MSASPTVQDLGFHPGEIERRKQAVRDLWAGRPLQHVPVYVTVRNPRPRYTVREQLLDPEKQWAEAITVAGLTWRHVPEGDMVPAVRPDVGCSCLASAFGAELYWGEDPAQTCGVRSPILASVEEALALRVPSPLDGQLAEGTERVRKFAERGEGLLSVSLLDMAGGLNVAMDLLGGDRLYVAMRESPDALDLLLEKIQRLFLSAVELQVRAAGGEGNITTTDFLDLWFPEGRKGHASDDICANISPALYDRFSRPCHDLVFRRYGGGGIHNCGPHPCVEGYLSHRPPPRALDVSYRFSRRELSRMKGLLRRRAFVYMNELPSAPAEMVRAFGEIMEVMTPDVIVVPHVAVSLDDDPAGAYRALRKVAEEYARRMDWGWDC